MNASDCRRMAARVAKRAAKYRRLEKLMPTTDMFFAQAVASWEIAAQLAELRDQLELRMRVVDHRLKYSGGSDS